MPTSPLTIVDNPSDCVKHTRLGKGKQPVVTDPAAVSSESRRDSGIGAEVTPGRLHRQSWTLAVLKNRNVGKVEKLVSLFEGLNCRRLGVGSPVSGSGLPVPILSRRAETKGKEKVRGHKGKQKESKDVDIAVKQRSRIPRKAGRGEVREYTRTPTTAPNKLQSHAQEMPTSPLTLASLLRNTTLSDLLLPPHHQREIIRILDDISSHEQSDPSKFLAILPPHTESRAQTTHRVSARLDFLDANAAQQVVGQKCAERTVKAGKVLPSGGVAGICGDVESVGKYVPRRGSGLRNVWNAVDDDDDDGDGDDTEVEVELRKLARGKGGVREWVDEDGVRCREV